MQRVSHFPQYKEKSANLQSIPLALFTYPVLQSADILLYRATHVPVGADQSQHIDFARDMALKFNKHFQCNFFPVPTSVVEG